MSDEDEVQQQRLREAAYRLWEEAGCPEGSETHFWALAKGRMAEGQAAPAGVVAGPPPASDPPGASVAASSTPPAPRVLQDVARPRMQRPAEPVPEGWRAALARGFKAWWEFPSGRR